MSLDGFISIAEAARVTGTTRQNIHCAIKLGTLRARRLGYFWVVQVADLWAWRRKVERRGRP